MDARPVLILGGGGHVGSALVEHLTRRGVPHTSVDSGLRAAPECGRVLLRDFRDLTTDELAEYRCVVLLAGHSSVGACARDPEAAFANNVGAFVELVHKLRGQRLLFASTSSVYVDTAGRAASESDPLPDPVCPYDLHKRMVEQYARAAYSNWFALRFGTVCGSSPAMRIDVLLNSLVRSALAEGHVKVANRNKHRPVLGINDLCRAVEVLLTADAEPGPYNVVSFNITVGAAADYVAGRFGVQCIEVESPTRYDMCVSTEKLARATGIEFRDTIEGLVDELETALLARLGKGR